MARVEFRDGPRDVPEHVEAILKGIETFSLTYDQAIAAANARMTNNYVSRGMSRVRDTHARDFGRVRQ